MHPLDPLFHPSHVAILGVSADPAKHGYQYAASLLRTGYRGKVSMVNRRGGELQGHRLHTSIKEVKGEIDLVFCALGPEHTPAAMAEAARRGARFAVIFTSGFAEMGAEGARRQAEMVADARAHGMRIVGPNCMGIFSLDCGLNLTGEVNFARGPVGMISHSGNVAGNIWFDAPKLDIGFSKFVGFGNQADICAHEYLEYLGQDPETQVILIYLEGLRPGMGTEFVRVAREVARAKPIVAIKGGRTPGGGRAARSHTASLAGEARAYSAAFRQAGIIEVDRLEELLPVAETLCRCPPLQDRRLAVVGSGGGHSILATDALELNGFEVPRFSPGVQVQIAARLPPWAPAGNPVDMTGAFLQDLSLFAQCTRLALADGQGLAGSLNYALYGLFPSPDHQDSLGRTFASAAPLLGEVQAETGKPIVFFTPFARERYPAFSALRAAGIPCYDSLDLAARCLRALWQRGEMLAQPGAPESAAPALSRSGEAHLAAARARRQHNLTEPEALAFLASHGVPVLPHRVASGADAAVAAARALGFPVVLKVVSPDILHKSEAGGVALDLRDAAAVAAAHAAVLADVRQRAPGAAIDGVLVAPHVTTGTEVIAGLYRDATFGPMVMAGMGGIFAEVLADAALGLAPVGPSGAAAMLRELRGFPLLTGQRGRPPADLSGLASLLVRLGEIAGAYPEIAELDLNPVFASPAGAVAADARIILAP